MARKISLDIEYWMLVTFLYSLTFLHNWTIDNLVNIWRSFRVKISHNRLIGVCSIDTSRASLFKLALFALILNEFARVRIFVVTNGNYECDVDCDYFVFILFWLRSSWELDAWLCFRQLALYFFLNIYVIHVTYINIKLKLRVRIELAKVVIFD